MIPRYYTTIVALLLSATAVQAQTSSPAACADPIQLTSTPLAEPQRALLRALSITAPAKQSYLFRASSMPATVCADGFAFLSNWRPAASTRSYSILPVYVSLLTNSVYPKSVNDGGAWDGKGANFAATAGVRASWRWFNAQIAPEAFWQQNSYFIYVHAAFDGFSPYVDPYRGTQIDYPTRFGPKSFGTITPGQSFIQASARGLSATLGTENLWVGAADQFPILMSYTAPGFPHVRIGTQRPLHAGIANVEFQAVWGSLHESDYFDGNPGNNTHLYVTTYIAIEPHITPGLYLGVARAYHDTVAAGGHGPGYYIGHLVSNPFGSFHGGNDTGNAIGILFGRWVLPESGFEVYAEWAREDTPDGLKELLRQPEWTQAYALGFAKAYKTPVRVIRLYGEMTHLGESDGSRAARGFFSYYTHSRVNQGHTNEGQLLGAAIGPGSNVELVGTDVFGAKGRTKFQINRTRYDNDTYFREFARRWDYNRHDAELTFLASRLQFVGPLQIEGGLEYSRRYGRQFIPLPSEGPDLVENNLSLRLSGAWTPRVP